MGTNQDGYGKAKAVTPPGDHRDKEPLCVNWNPTPDWAALSGYGPPQEPSPQLPDDFNGIDMPAFINRLRALASQI